MTKSVSDDGVELTAKRDAIPLPLDFEEPDPDWEFVDSAGHPHRYSEDSTVPTLEAFVIESHYCPECDYEWEETALRCRECGETVRPGTRMPTVQRYEVGPLRVSGRLPPWHPLAKDLAAGFKPGFSVVPTKLDITLTHAGLTVTGAVATGIDGDGWVEFMAKDLEAIEDERPRTA